VLECIAPPHLHVDRFLPPTPLDFVLDQTGADSGTSIRSELRQGVLKSAEPRRLFQDLEVVRELIPILVQSAEALVRQAAEPLISLARAKMKDQLGSEILRLRALREVNPNVRPEEIALLEAQQEEIDRILSLARPRLDAIRLIRRG
jgi:ATP-dependent helicase HepA